MKIHINKDQLTLGLSRVIDATSNKVSMPVLCSVLLSASGESLSLYGTSLEMSASTSVKATVAKDGAIALPAKRLQQIVREMPDGVIVIDSAGPRATISAGKARFQITGYEAKEFPEAKPAIESNKVDSTCTALLGMIQSVQCAASSNPNQPTYCGIYIEVKDYKLALKATTGTTAVAINSKTIDAKHDAGVIVPMPAIAVLSRLLADGLSVHMSFDENGISFVITTDGGDVRLHSSVITGNFPPVERAIPVTSSHIVKAPRGALVSALRRVSLATDELTTYVRLMAEGNKLTLRASSSKYGEAEESIECPYEGTGLDMHVGVKALLDPLSAMSCETVELRANEHTKPILLKTEDPGYIYLVAAVNVR